MHQTIRELTKLRVLLVSDAFPPARTSAAALTHDLAKAFARAGHSCTVVTPDPTIDSSFQIEHAEGYRVLRIWSAPLKRINLIRRAINEFLLSSRMWRGYRASQVGTESFDAIVFYSPTIFFGRFVARLKAIHNCRAYLVLRDVFPDWAADVGAMKRGPHYWTFKAFAEHQYLISDTIGIESPSNAKYFDGGRHRTEVLYNWIDLEGDSAIHHPVPRELAGKKIFVYAGNMGVAQDMDNILRLAARIRHREDCHFLLVGAGSEFLRIGEEIRRQRLANVSLKKAIHPRELRSLLRQCYVGLVSLDRRIRSHNVPGKILSYIEAGLPVLASVNSGNDVKSVIEDSGAGIVVWNGDDAALESAALKILGDDALRSRMGEQAALLCRKKFSAVTAVEQISRCFS